MNPLAPFPYDRFIELGPWVNAIEYAGRTWAGPAPGCSPTTQQSAVRRSRVEQLQSRIPSMQNVLELGALEGADTVHLAAIAQHVVAVEGRRENLRRAQFVIDLHKLNNITLVLGDIETLPLEQLGVAFNLTYCTGLLYHLEDPENLLKRLAKVTDNLFLQTHYWTPTAAGIPSSDLTSAVCSEDYPEERLRGLGTTARWLTREQLLSVLSDLGFSVAVLSDEILNGAASITLFASKEPSGWSRH